jgi:hypothetical protein
VVQRHAHGYDDEVDVWTPHHVFDVVEGQLSAKRRG